MCTVYNNKDGIYTTLWAHKRHHVSSLVGQTLKVFCWKSVVLSRDWSIVQSRYNTTDFQQNTEYMSTRPVCVCRSSIHRGNNHRHGFVLLCLVAKPIIPWHFSITVIISGQILITPCTKWPTFCRWNFLTHLPEWKLLHLNSILTEVSY